jgi:hypothetical protein
MPHLSVSPQIERRCDAIDKLVSIDMSGRRVIGLLYDEARREAGMPLSLRAAETLRRAMPSPGKIALIATGWLDRPHVSLSIAETDGPPGAVALARALHIGLGAIPFILVEEQIVDATIAVVHAAGLRCVSPEESLNARGGSGALHVASVIGMPSDRKAAEAFAEDLLSRFDVGAFIAIEKGGENARGRINTSRGFDTTDALAKADAVLEACRARGIPSVGIGDGGNEIGMGSIREGLAGKLRNSIGPSGTSDDGVVPVNKVDALVAASVSNWGAYGVATALAVLLDRPDVLHTVEIEEQILRASAAAGFIDGVTGYVGPTSDGLPLQVNTALIRLLRTLVGDGVDTRIWKANASSPRPDVLPYEVPATTTRWDLDLPEGDKAMLTCNQIDQLLSIDMPQRDVIDIAYSVFRKFYGAPLSYLAAKQLEKVQQGQLVVIATGFPNRLSIDPNIAESDGPVGAAVLARAVHLGLGAVPVILIEEQLMGSMAKILHAVGLRVLDLEAAKLCANPKAAQHAAAILASPVDWEAARAQAADLVANHNVGALVAIEKAGANPEGELLFSRGRPGTEYIGKVDPLLRLCAEKGIPTIGIGDGGNEIGMGNADGALRDLLIYGDKQYNGGIVPAHITDAAVPVTVSNWGGYGIAAALAAVLGRPDIVHDEATERRMLLACSLDGLIDGVTGSTLPTSDGMGEEIHVAIVTMLRTILGIGVPVNDWPVSTSKS